MSTSIPPSMTWEMLSRLPANSFVFLWKEIRPDVEPANGLYFISGGQVTPAPRFNLRGSPNEFAINTDMYISGEISGKSVVTEVADKGFLQDDILQLTKEPLLFIHSPFQQFNSSRESFNAGALPFLDNQNTRNHHIINQLRFMSARRNRRKQDGAIDDVEGAYGADNTKMAVGYSSVDSGRVLPEFGVSESYSYPNRILGSYVNGANDGFDRKVQSFGKNRGIRIPLGLYSNIANCPAVLPLGLFSSYAVNGWQIDLGISTGDQSFTGNANVAVVAIDGTGEENTAVAHQVEMRQLRIWVPVVRVLDPAVMSSVLALYEKQEAVNVGPVSFPLSLRLNSLGYRTANFSLNSGQTDYFFRLAGTDRSVRGYAWYVYRPNSLGQVLTSTSSQPVIRTTRLETHIGTERVHEVVEDTSLMTNNIANFVSINADRVAYAFSPLPYYREGVLSTGHQNDDMDKYNNCLSSINYRSDTTNDRRKADISRSSLCYGYVSFENLDRREGDYSGSFQASGKDLTNVGAIEVRMTIGSVVPPANPTGFGDMDNYALSGNDLSDYNILFVYAYDSVMEVSPQGVMDITNASL